MITNSTQWPDKYCYTNLCACVCMCVWHWLSDMMESTAYLRGRLQGVPLWPVSPKLPHLRMCLRVHERQNVCVSSLSIVGCISHSSSIMTERYLSMLPWIMTLRYTHAASMLMKVIYDLGEMTSCLSWMISLNDKGGNPSFDCMTWLNLNHDILAW